jgi:8-oxo-dGTP pyrophosphatase MutT (NUDIX family)
MPRTPRRSPRGPAGSRRAAAALCVRRKRGRLQLLLVTTRSGRATLPKGRVEAGEHPADTALREAREEAGVRGVVAAHLGSWCHGRAGQHVDGYLVRVRSRGRPRPSERWRKVRWVDLEPAADQLAGRCARRADRDALRTAIRTAATLVAG